MNKDLERYFLQEFLKLMPDLHGLEPIDSETPDFLCDVAGVLTGIELTRFFFPSSDGSPPQATEAFHTRLGNELRETHLKSAITPVHASVSMHCDQALFKNDQRAALKNELLAFVSHHTPPQGPHMEFDSESLSQSLRDKGVDSIIVLNAHLTEPSWSISYASGIPESSSSIIQGILDRKAPLIPQYRKKAAAIWLLILSGTDGLHSSVHLDGDILTHTYSTLFDRVFLFRMFGASANELKRV